MSRLGKVTTMTTLDPLIHRYIDHRHRTGEITLTTAVSLRSLLAGLSTTHGNRPLDQYGPKTIDRWRESIGHLAPATRANYTSHVRSFSRWLIAQGKITADPTTHLRPIPRSRRAPVTLTPPEVGKLIAHAPDLRAEAIVELMVGCGCRCVEVSRLRVDDYDPRSYTIRLRGKGGHEREIHVPAETRHALDAYLETVGRVAGPLIRNEVHPNRPLAPKTISIYVRRWMRTSGVKVRALDGRSAHGLRRTCGSDVMDQTGDIRVVQEMLGHADIQTTAAYYLRRVTADQLRDAMEGRSYRHALPEAA